MIDFSVIDADSSITKLAGEGNLAISNGHTLLAARQFLLAAKKLKAASRSVTNSRERSLLQFLAASHYFYGGHYGIALRVVRRVESRLLPDQAKSLFDDFVREAESRADSEYAKKVLALIDGHRRKCDATAVIELLKAHPYVLAEADLAFIRAIMCEQLGHHKAAAMFFAAAFKGKPNDLNRIVQSTVFPFGLSIHRKTSETWEFSRYLAAEFPHPITKVIASVVCYHLAGGDPRETELWSQRQLEYHRDANALFLAMPPSTRQDVNLKDILLFCHETAAFGFLRLGMKKEALALGKKAVEMSPESPGPRIVRGILTFPAPEAIADLELAIKLGDQSYLPHLRLAFDALGKNDPVRLMKHCSRALEFELNTDARAILMAWLAISKDALGHPREEIEVLFREAIALNPDNEKVLAIQRIFLAEASHPTKSLSVRYSDVTYPSEFRTFGLEMEALAGLLRKKFSGMVV